ncbi:MAG: mechanosensitive ion channel family protein [Erysipelotrichaceae bacterium]|nr:mechanosensitive ion channel family protein [Erysipelotrichaceae bacterium]MDY5251714.1 mechanosensitive ion channel family protein [Erysipelotrichaceae bacterium]
MSEFLFSENSIFKHGLVYFLITFIILYIIAFIFDKGIKFLVDAQLKKKGKKAANLLFIYKVLKTGGYSLALLLALFEIKVFSNFTVAVLGASGIFAAIAGLAAQESLGNLISGFFLSMFQPFNLGDLITIKSEQITGTVVELGLRHTVINTYENTRVVIPNSRMNSAIIENKAFEDINYNNFLYLGISYDSDIAKAKEIIIKNCEQHPLVIDNRTPEEKARKEPLVKIFVTNLGDYAVELRATIITYDVSDGFKAMSDLRESIKKDFDDNGIVIPFPTHIIKNQ